MLKSAAGVSAVAIAGMLAGCSGSPMGEALSASQQPSAQPATPSPTFATPGTSTDEEWTGPTCKEASRDAMKVSRKNNRGTVNPVLIAVIRIKGPVVDKTMDPPRNGDVYVCTGTGVWSSDSNSKIRFGYTRKGGQWFTFYKQA